MRTVLSTKILTPQQRELFLNSGLGLVEYDALQIEFLEAAIPASFPHLIFTSKNAVKAFLAQKTTLKPAAFTVFCVGEKTKALLEDFGLKVTEMAPNAVELAQLIAKNYKNESFLFPCGNQRRNELPQILKENNIRYKEIVVYKTILTPKKYDRVFDGLLFFSPSGIKSHSSENPITESWLFCIGETTAYEARKYSKNIITANKPTVENVLVQAIKKLKVND
ncbi:uroporphyrinogen-III synthase [Flagellimonas flava]|uniref:Uroporphyrinogen-III synthase n=1 Tax=Flagellimonas flava TaxID=570519 RepID=A0A1M5MKP8_9FLAO|nr:uroporphyrinogen-III synthase [Allomuricauda flava]SHG77960.1 uroporphyrinogen-III synthase [Allomuricauda flava]